MFKLTNAPAAREPKKIFLSEIPMGTTFYARLFYDSYPILFLRMWNGLVNINTPSHVWDVPENSPTGRSFDLYDYRPVDIVGEIREIEGAK